MQIQREGILFCFIGPSGGGKTTLCTKLLEDYDDLFRSISATTRAPREGEVEGESYFFLTRAVFEEKIEAGEFFEWEEIHDELYGSFRSAITDAIQNGRDLLLDIDIKGAMTFKKHFPRNIEIVFVLPPDPETLVSRIKKRSHLEKAELVRRLETAREEYQMLLEIAEVPGQVDYFVINDDFEETYQHICKIVDAERTRLHRMDVQSLHTLCRVD